MKKKIVSRRRFVGLGSLAAAGSAGALWLHTNSRWAAWFLRERFEEASFPVLQPKFRPTPTEWNPNAITASWLGHATVLINFYGITILTDPVLYRRVGAHLGLGTIGPKRLIAPALSIRELPPIDLILLSHAHLDHLDVRTLRHFRNGTRVITARATADILGRNRLAPASELGWGESEVVRTAQGEVHVRAFEVKHWGARWRRDIHRGYNGYIIEREGKKIIFGGDTAYTKSFADLRSKGPFELACMPIGAYEPWIWNHCNPEEAVAMGNEAGAAYLLPMHHQTFRLGRERRTEPMERFQAALQKEPERIALREIGETFSCAKG